MKKLADPQQVIHVAGILDRGKRELFVRRVARRRELAVIAGRDGTPGSPTVLEVAGQLAPLARTQNQDVHFRATVASPTLTEMTSS